MKARISLLLIQFALGLGLPAAAADTAQQLLQQRGQWQFEDPAAWEWQGQGHETVLVLKKPSQYKPKVRRPFNLAWFAGAEWDSFTLTCEARLDAFNKGNNDLCIAFAGTGDSQFYYAHLGEKADGVHLQLHVVDNADRRAIATHRAETLPWEPGRWHAIQVVRQAASHSIKVWFDGKLVLEASDKTLGQGRIGLGSFDDLGAFRNVIVTSAAATDAKQQQP